MAAVGSPAGHRASAAALMVLCTALLAAATVSCPPGPTSGMLAEEDQLAEDDGQEEPTGASLLQVRAMPLHGVSTAADAARRLKPGAQAPGGMAAAPAARSELVASDAAETAPDGFRDEVPSAAAREQGLGLISTVEGVSTHLATGLAQAADVASSSPTSTLVVMPFVAIGIACIAVYFATYNLFSRDRGDDYDHPLRRGNYPGDEGASPPGEASLTRSSGKPSAADARGAPRAKQAARGRCC
mmetsp:Transcript_27716/g.70108  ORF Transcript_27716/g.70108 Transcript_27716/m.70108 type:complete len:243 (+) Transcript_27716:93-821(+)